MENTEFQLIALATLQLLAAQAALMEQRYGNDETARRLIESADALGVFVDNERSKING